MTLSAVIPTLNAARGLAATLDSIRSIDDIVVVDGGSTDDTVIIARGLGARVIASDRGRGKQLRMGAEAARHAWLLFLHADTVLEKGWHVEAQSFMSERRNLERAATFRFALDDSSDAARRLEWFVGWRTRSLGLPYGDQGLLIHRDFYNALGGFPPWPLMEDVDLVRRIGRHRLVPLQSAARTSAIRWQEEGWALRSARNLSCLLLFHLGAPPRLLIRLYGR